MNNNIILVTDILYLIETKMTPEKIKEIEDRSEFRLFLRRVGFKSFNEYKEMCKDEELEHVNEKEVIMRFLSEYDKKKG